MKLVVSAIALCGAVLLGSAALSSQAQAGSASGSWVGPHGGTVHYHGYRGPYRYRGAVTYTAPDGRTYRRVTKVRRGPHGRTYVSRRWVGPNGAYYRGRVYY
jgi:hypothetical protein